MARVAGGTEPASDVQDGGDGARAPPKNVVLRHDNLVLPERGHRLRHRPVREHGAHDGGVEAHLDGAGQPLAPEQVGERVVGSARVPARVRA